MAGHSVPHMTKEVANIFYISHPELNFKQRVVVVSNFLHTLGIGIKRLSEVIMLCSSYSGTL